MIIQPAELRDLRVKEDQRYVPNAWYDSLRARIGEFWEHAQDCLAGGGSRRRLFAVIGESGTGKTTALRHVLNSTTGLQPHQNEHGSPKIPLIGIELSRTCTTKELALRMLEQLGQHHIRTGTEEALFNAVKEQLREAGTIFVHLDEAQHLMKSGSDAAVRGLQDRFKSLLAIPDWPLHLILSGVPDLAALFMGDPQLANRSLVMRFDALQFPSEQKIVEDILSDIAVKHCGLKLDKELTTDDFLRRLVRATGGGAGTMIEMIRAASYKALSKGHAKLSVKDFAFVYGRVSGSLVSDNIMSADLWANLDRSNALVDLVPLDTNRRRKGRK